MRHFQRIHRSGERFHETCNSDLGGGRQNPDRNGTQADAKKQQERYVQRDVQTNAEAKDHAESQSKAAVKTKVEGSHRKGKR